MADSGRQSFGLTAALGVVLLLLFVYRAEIAPIAADAVSVAGAPLGRVVDGWFADSLWLTQLAVILLAVVNVMVVMMIATRYMLYGVRSFKPVLFYLVAACGLVIPAAPVSVYLAGLLIVMGMTSLVSCFKRGFAPDTVFRGALLLGMAPLLLAQAAVYIVLVPLAVGIFLRSGRELVVGVVGALLPAAVCCYVWWWTGGGFLEPLQAMWTAVTGGERMPVGEWGIPRLVCMGLGVLAALFSAVTLISGKVMRYRSRKILTFIALAFLFGMGLFALPGPPAAAIPLVAAPFAILAPLWFMRRRTRFSTLFFAIYILSAAAANLWPLLG